MTDEEVWRAIENLTEAIEEQNRQMRIQNAVLAVSAVNAESRDREKRRDEPPTTYNYSWSRFGADFEDALWTLEEEYDIA